MRWRAARALRLDAAATGPPSRGRRRARACASRALASASVGLPRERLAPAARRAADRRSAATTAPFGARVVGRALAPRRLDLPRGRHVDRGLHVVGPSDARRRAAPARPPRATRRAARASTARPWPPSRRAGCARRRAASSRGATATSSPSASESDGLSTSWSPAVDAVEHFDALAVVAADLDRLAAATRLCRVDRGDAHAFAAEHAARWSGSSSACARLQRQRDLHVGAGQSAPSLFGSATSICIVRVAGVDRRRRCARPRP